MIDLSDEWDYYRKSKEFGQEYLDKYPLYFMTLGTQLQDNSNWGNMPYITKRVIKNGNAEIFMHPDDMKARGISDGDTVEARNEKGTTIFTAVKTTQVRSDVCYAWNNIWIKTTQSKSGANALCSDGISDLGEGSTYMASFIEVKRAKKQYRG